jgi:glycosyltransferase involved in cell wall biosynthesis
MKKVKIAVLCCGGTYQSMSGGDIHIINLIEVLSNKSDVSVFLPEKANAVISEILNRCEAKIIKIKDLFDVEKKEDLGLAYLFRARMIIKALREKHFDLIVTTNPFFCDILPLLYINKNKTTIVSYIFHVLPERSAVSKKEKIINTVANIQESICFNIIKRKADLILTCNNIERDKIIKRMGNIDARVSKLGIDTKFIDSVKLTKKKKDTAIFVGRLVKQKGVYDLIKIIKKIVRLRKNFKLYIVGGGPEKENLLTEIRKQKLKDHIFLLGYLSKNDLFKKMKESEYFFFPSYEEGFGIVIAEALYCKNKVICFKLDHYPEFFKEFPEYARLGDINDFVDKIGTRKDLKSQKRFIGKYEIKKRIAFDVESIFEKLKRKN